MAFSHRPYSKRPSVTVMYDKALVLDDDQIRVEFMKLRASVDGFEILEAKDIEDAVAVCSAERPDVIVVNIATRRFDALRLLKDLGERPETLNLPVLLISKDNQDEVVLDCMKAGARDYISQPFEIDALFERMKKAAKSVRKTQKTAPPKAVFSGNLEGFDWANIVQFLEWNRKSGVLVFRDRRKNMIGKLHFKNGALIGGETRRFKGEEALFALWGQNKGSFEFHSQEEDVPVTIKNKNNALLMKAARMEDDYRRFLSFMPSPDAQLRLENQSLPPKLVERFGEEALFETISLVVESRYVRKVLRDSPLSLIRTGSILYSLFVDKHVFFANEDGASG